MSWHKVAEPPPDLRGRLSQIAELDRPQLVSPRRPMDDELETPEVEPSEVNASDVEASEAPLLDVEVHVGWMYVLAESHDGPGFTQAIRLRPNRRTGG